MYAVIAPAAFLLALLITGRLYPGGVPYLIGIPIALLIIGLFQQSFEQLTRAMIRPVLQLDKLPGAIRTKADDVQAYIRKVRGEKGLHEETVFNGRLIGTVLFGVLSVALALAEWYLITESLRGLIPNEAGDALVLASLEPYLLPIIAAVIVTGALAWGILLSDIEGRTNMTPYHDTPAENRDQFRKQARTMLALFGCLFVCLAAWRGLALLPADGSAVNFAPHIGEKVVVDFDKLVAEQQHVQVEVTDSTNDPFGMALTITVQVGAALLVFMTLIETHWIFEWTYVFLLLGIAKCWQSLLWLASLLIRFAHFFIRSLAEVIVLALDFVRRVGVLVAKPIAARLDPIYIDAMPNSVADDAEDPSKHQGSISPARQEGRAGVADPDLDDERVHQVDTATETGEGLEDYDHDAQTIEDDESNPNTHNRNWSPYGP